MKWVVFESEGRRHLGVWDGDEVRERSGPDWLERAAGLTDLPTAPERTWSQADVTLCAPVPRPPSLRDFVAFEQHITNGAGGTPPPDDWYEIPVFYFSNPAAVCGPGEPVAISPGSRAFDYELEVAAVIGKGGRDIPVDQADEHVFGFTIMCDFSARDLQARESKLGLGPCKGKDGATSLGPWLVTPDELAAYRTERGYALSMTAAVNGVRYTSGRLSEMYWSFAQLIAFASRGTTLVPGDVIGSGTVGTGCILEHRMLGRKAEYPWLRAGDVLELSVEGLGELRHTITAPQPAEPLWLDERRPVRLATA